MARVIVDIGPGGVVKIYKTGSVQIISVDRQRSMTLDGSVNVVEAPEADLPLEVFEERWAELKTRARALVAGAQARIRASAQALVEE